MSSGSVPLLLAGILICLAVMAGFITKHQVEQAAEYFLWGVGGVFALGALVWVVQWKEDREKAQEREERRRAEREPFEVVWDGEERTRRGLRWLGAGAALVVLTAAILLATEHPDPAAPLVLCAMLFPIPGVYKTCSGMWEARRGRKAMALKRAEGGSVRESGR